jgi:hypothetical protein
MKLLMIMLGIVCLMPFQLLIGDDEAESTPRKIQVRNHSDHTVFITSDYKKDRGGKHTFRAGAGTMKDIYFQTYGQITITVPGRKSKAINLNRSLTWMLPSFGPVCIDFNRYGYKYINGIYFQDSGSG